MTPKQILVTGSAGRIGRAVVAGLTARGHQVTGYDLRPTPGLATERSFVASLADLEALRQAASGVDTIIHLAATPDDARFPRGPSPDDEDNFLSELVPNNIVAPYQLMELARQSGVKRTVLASTGQVVDGYLRTGPIPVTDQVPTRPRYLYACTKVFLEALGQVYAQQHGITVLAVRLGWCPRDVLQVAEIESSELGQDVYLSPGDASRFFLAAVETELLPAYSALYATSRYLHLQRYDLERARELLGWEPQDQWPVGSQSF
jgi:nucleoside-diphosphate-sugar epimerase